MADPKVFILDDCVKMSPQGRIFSLGDLGDYARANPAWNGKAITLSGARGERVAFQVMVQAGDQALEAVDAYARPLHSTAAEISPGQFSLFREHYVEVTLPSTSPQTSAGAGWYPDALVPAGLAKHALPVEVPAGAVQGIWVDLAIPRETAPGDYAGQLVVLERGDNLAELPVRLRVYDFELPRERHLRWRAGYLGFEAVARHFGHRVSNHCGQESKEFRAMELELYRLCWDEHRLAPTTHYNSPIPRHTGSGPELKIDWTTYDRRFGAYLDGSAFDDRVPLNIFSLPVNTMGGWPTGGKNLGAPQQLDLATLQAATSAAAQHWDQKGWRLTDSFVYVGDEVAPDKYPLVKDVCRTVRSVDSRIAASLALCTDFAARGQQVAAELAGFVTMWDIAGDCFDPAVLAGRRDEGDSVGFYQGSEPFQGSEALDGDGLSLVTWPWIAWRYQLDRLFLYNMTEWDYFRLDTPAGREKPWAHGLRDIWINPLNQSWQTNSQGVLVYPGWQVGLAGVVPSIRLKQVRRGMQDYEYFWLLAQKGCKAQADEICRRIMPAALGEATGNKFGPDAYGPGLWQRDPRAWAAARAEMAEMIQKA